MKEYYLHTMEPSSLCVHKAVQPESLGTDNLHMVLSKSWDKGDFLDKALWYMAYHISLNHGCQSHSDTRERNRFIKKR